MFRVYVPVFSVLVALVVLLSVVPADAGQRGVRIGVHYKAVHLLSGRRVHYPLGARHIRKLHLFSRFAGKERRSHNRYSNHHYKRPYTARLYLRLLDRRYADRRHDYNRRDKSGIRHSGNWLPSRLYYSDGGLLMIAIDKSASTDMADTTDTTDTVDSSGIFLQNGSCAAGKFCRLRLGSHTNSPEVIKLNTSGTTITDPAFLLTPH